MGSFRCYDNSGVIAALMMTNCHLNTTVVAIFPNVCLRRRIEPPSYARTAYVVVIWPSFLLDAFVKIWATWKIFLGKWFTALPGKTFLVRLWAYQNQWTTSQMYRLTPSKVFFREQRRGRLANVVLRCIQNNPMILFVLSLKRSPCQNIGHYYFIIINLDPSPLVGYLVLA